MSLGNITEAGKIHLTLSRGLSALLWWMRQICHTIIAGGVVWGKHTGGVIQRWSPIGPVDLLCLGPNDLFGGSIVVRNNLQKHIRKNAWKHSSIAKDEIVHHSWCNHRERAGVTWKPAAIPLSSIYQEGKCLHKIQKSGPWNTHAAMWGGFESFNKKKTSNILWTFGISCMNIFLSEFLKGIYIMVNHWKG